VSFAFSWGLLSLLTQHSIAHLVGFALKLRNLGVSDHGLIRELSAPLAGSLYSGEGHSRLYDDEQVYEYVDPLPFASLLLIIFQSGSHARARDDRCGQRRVRGAQAPGRLESEPVSPTVDHARPARGGFCADRTEL
jgi:hypothetical protein